MKIAIIGYGKMGKVIEQLALKDGHEIVLRIGANNQINFNASQLETADVAIEFSQPEAVFRNLMICFDANVPVVSGTTGWLEKFEEAKRICKEKDGSFFYASNFSIGVNLFFAINQYVAKLMNTHPQYRPSITEIHHTQKLDAPSGTAISLAKGILANLDRMQKWENQPSDATDTLEIISERIDKVPGTHSIVYQSSIDEIEIKHTAHSREGFARGALLAANWLVGKKGFFQMNELLGI